VSHALLNSNGILVTVPRLFFPPRYIKKATNLEPHPVPERDDELMKLEDPLSFFFPGGGVLCGGGVCGWGSSVAWVCGVWGGGGGGVVVGGGGVGFGALGGRGGGGGGGLCVGAWVWGVLQQIKKKKKYKSVGFGVVVGGGGAPLFGASGGGFFCGGGFTQTNNKLPPKP